MVLEELWSFSSLYRDVLYWWRQALLIWVLSAGLQYVLQLSELDFRLLSLGLDYLEES